MVPATSLADLHNVDAEFAVLPRHRLELLCRSDPARVWPELIAEDVGHVRQLLLAAHRAVALCRLAVMLCGTQQVGIGIANIGRRRAALEQRSQRRSPLKRVVDVTTLRPHACQSTRSWRARTTRLEARIRRLSPGAAVRHPKVSRPPSAELTLSRYGVCRPTRVTRITSRWPRAPQHPPFTSG